MAIKKTRRPKSKNYFTQETEDAIVLYNGTSDTDVKSKIYEKEIHYPFFKLTENIIHTFKFYHTEQEGLKHIPILELLLNVTLSSRIKRIIKNVLKRHQ